MTTEKDIVYLAALLHDIGKFYQRADDSGASSSRILSDNVKGLECMIAPKNSKTQLFTHKHVLWTAQFFEDQQQHLAPYLANIPSWNLGRLMQLSAAHHNPNENNLLERIIQKADHYSSGVDRDVEGGWGWKDAAEESDDKWDAFKRTRMRSIFEGISLTESWTAPEAYKYKLPLCATVVDNQYFPYPVGQKEDAADYKTLWKNFENEMKFIQNKTLRSLNDSLLFLLEKYTNRIPASTQHLPDVSLYDHLKTTAAFANCLKAYIDDKNLNELPGPDEKPFVLLGGAISGIQKFIYGIVAKGAAKNLKGRSFYLELLVNNIVLKILEALELQQGNVIYASGGGFYIIAPNLIGLTETIGEIEKLITKKLYEYHGIELYLTIDWEPFGESQIYEQHNNDNNIGAVWSKLSEKLSHKKATRFGILLADQYANFFEPNEVNPESEKDTITGEEINGKPEYLDEENKEQPVNDYTYKQIELGKALKGADYWLVSKDRLTYFPDNIFQMEPIGLGYYNYLVSEDLLNNKEYELRKSADNVKVYYFNKVNFLDPVHKGINNNYGFAWYGGNDFPEVEWKQPNGEIEKLPKVFEELCGVVLNKESYKKDAKRKTWPELTRLGVLRMDVDNLGAIFKGGLEPAKRSFSRYSTLSRSMDWFFKGYLNTIWRKSKQHFDEYTQIIYSGGDDLFIVGKWDILIQMAAEIKQAFTDWVCGNPQLTLSGGMAIVGPKFPILKSAAYSETFEKAAKKHHLNGADKNAFAFLAYTPQHAKSEEEKQIEELILPMRWDTEFDYLTSLKNEIVDYLDNGLNEGFSGAIYNLLQQAKMELNEQGRYYPKNHEVVWLAAYQFKRSSNDKVEGVQQFLRHWVKNIMTGRISDKENLADTRYHALQYLALAARWAALEKRSKLKNVNN